MAHQLTQCPAYRKTCSNCGKLNHFKEMCRDTPKQGGQTVLKKQVMHDMQQDEEESWQNMDDIRTGINMG